MISLTNSQLCTSNLDLGPVVVYKRNLILKANYTVLHTKFSGSVTPMGLPFLCLTHGYHCFCRSKRCAPNSADSKELRWTVSVVLQQKFGFFANFVPNQFWKPLFCHMMHHHCWYVEYEKRHIVFPSCTHCWTNIVKSPSLQKLRHVRAAPHYTVHWPVT
jgi:hypothetical protein